MISYRGQPVGMIALHDISHRHRHAVMGRFLIGEAEAVSGTAVAYESELLVCDYAYDALKMHKLHGDVLATNEAMLRWRKYLGWSKDGVLRDHYVFDGQYATAIMFSLMEEEYRRRCRPRLLGLVSAASASR
jgi:RimJ/RimL family protein N-acetyltransferase